MAISNLAYTAPIEPGYIIHTGLKKIYTNSTADKVELSQDILRNSHDPNFINKFYRFTEDGKYINLAEEEKMQLEVLAELIKEKGLTNPNEIKDFLADEDNQAIIEERLKQINLTIYTFDTEEYVYASSPLLMDGKYYSTPQPGFKEGTTKIATLLLPPGASKWQIRILDEEDKGLIKDMVLEDAKAYYRNQDIEIAPGQILGLYAVDKDSKLKAYANIKIEEDMINRPRELAPELELDSIEIRKGEKYAGAVVINGLEDGQWKVSVSNSPIANVYKDMNLDKAISYSGGDIVVANENELHPIKDSFKKYLLVMKIDEKGLVEGYKTFEIGKGDISLPPTRLEETAHYVGPVPGAEDGTSKFEALYFGSIEATAWRVLAKEEPINVPKLDVNINEIGDNPINPVGNEVEASVGYYLLLAAVDSNGNIKGYRIFQLSDDMVKGKTAPELPKENYSQPTKGSVPGTTRIETLNLGGIEGASKWMYVVGTEFDAPILNKTVQGSKDYVAGDNISVNMDDIILLLATDAEGRVKAYTKIVLKDYDDPIKDPPAIRLQEGVNYVGPVKGTTPYTTSFEGLYGSQSIGNNITWMYLIQDEEPEIPEYDSNAQGTEFSAGTDIPANPGQYLMLLATTSESKVKGYAIFRLTEAHINLGPAIELKEGEHFSTAEKGSGPGTTKITQLNFKGIEGVEEWRIKVSNEKLLEDDEKVEYNSIVPQTSGYREGQDIRAAAGDWILLLATDRSGRVKAYAHFQLGKDSIRNPNATLLMPTTNYIGPLPGGEENSTRFEFLDFSTNIKDATKWMYKIGDKPFKDMELDSRVEGAQDYQVNDNIEKVTPGSYLLLLATDEEGKVKGYREFRLTEREVRGGPAVILKPDQNYELEKGSRPGTTRFKKLSFAGVEGASSWRYKLLDEELEDKDKPYMNNIVDGSNYAVVGQDIQVNMVDGQYGYLLLLAVDGSNRTKGYAVIELSSAVVREHAPELNVELVPGHMVDSLKLELKENLSEGWSIKYRLSSTGFPIPAVDEILQGAMDYDDSVGILRLRIGDYLGVYAVDGENQIKKFKSFRISEDNISLGKAKIKEPEIILEGDINIGGQRIVIELSNGAKWADDIKVNSNKRNALYNGFRVNSESSEWNRVIDALIADGGGAIDVDHNKTTLTISLPEVKNYDITQDQIITLTIPAIAIENAINPIEAEGSITIKPTIRATIAGDVVDSIVRENDIKAGGKTIVIELEDGDWKVDIDKNDLINGFEVVGTDQQKAIWNAIAGQIKAENIVRNSSKKVTITLPSVDVDFGVEKVTLSLTIPSSLIQDAEDDVTAVNTFTLYPNVLQVLGEAVEDTVYLEAPDGRAPRNGMDVWKIRVDVGSLKANISNGDIVVAGLPRGLRADVDGVNLDSNTITIRVSGTASSKIDEERVSIRIKGTAVEEPNSMDSEDIVVTLKLSESKMAELEEVSYRLEEDENGNLHLYLIKVTEDMEYSLDSTNGINGKWEKITLETGNNEVKIGEAKPVRIWVREAEQTKVYHQAVNLVEGEAPANIVVKHYDYKNNIIGLEGLEANTNYEYSIDGGSTWSKLENGSLKDILGNQLDLRIRLAAIPGEEGQLPSKATGKLNGIYLGEVALNVAKGLIEKTTNSMEYSTNDAENFTRAANGNTNVRFAVGDKVWIRERNNPNNIRYLDEVGQEEFTEDELEKIDFDISQGKIYVDSDAVFTIKDLEYRIGNDSWKDVGEGSGIEFRAGELRFRKKGTSTSLPSVDLLKYTIKPPTPAPELAYDDIYHTIEKIGTEAGKDYEISINGNEWKAGDLSIVFEAGDEVRVRIAATDRTLPSQIQTIKFTPNLDLSNVYVDASRGLIVNTTTDMEYSFDTKTGFDGQWYRCSSTNTSLPLKEGMVIYIREAKKPGNFRLLTDKPLTKRPFNEIIVKERIGYSIADGTIWIRTGKDLSWLQEAVDKLQYRIGEENWINIDYVRLEPDKDNILAYNVEFKPGKLEFRLRGDTDYLPSNPIEKTVIKARASAPVVIINDGKDIVESINGLGRSKDWDEYEYSINSGPWISGRYLKTEDLTGNKTLRVRIKATKEKLPSQETGIEFTDNIALEHVILSTHVQPLELNGTTSQMEYEIWLGDANHHYLYARLACEEGNTKLPEWLKIGDVYQIIIRERNKPDNKYRVYP